jgi:putative redox protein
MVTVHVEYEGALRCRAVHGPSGNSLATDAPVDNHGKGETFSPTDLVATALGACIATTMGMVAEREGIDLTALRIEVRKEMVADPLRRIGGLATRISMPAGLTQAQRTKLERAARSCPVHRSLGEGVKRPLEFLYPCADSAAPEQACDVRRSTSEPWTGRGPA